MPDISMCNGTNCPLKEECYRHKATPSDWQPYFMESPIKEDGTCDYFMEIWKDEETYKKAADDK